MMQIAVFETWSACKMAEIIDNSCCSYDGSYGLQE